MIGEYHSREDNLAADWAIDPCCSSIVHTRLRSFKHKFMGACDSMLYRQ